MSETTQGAIDREKVREVIDRIRPAIQADGGDVELVEIDDEGIVKLRLMGACAGCPMSMITLSAGIERTLKQAIPGVKGVQPVM